MLLHSLCDRTKTCNWHKELHQSLVSSVLKHFQLLPRWQGSAEMVTKPQLRWVFPCWQHSSLWSVTTASTNRGYKGTLKSYHWSLCYCVRNGTREPKIEIWDKNLALNHSLARQPSKREAVWAITRRDGKLNTKSTSEGRICPFRLPVLSCA